MLVSLCRRNGGVYVKAGQLASQLSDVPRAYRDACATLQDRAGWRPYQEVESTLRAHSLLGALAHIDKTPAAAASLAQVRDGAPCLVSLRCRQCVASAHVQTCLYISTGGMVVCCYDCCLPKLFYTARSARHGHPTS